MKEAAEAAKAAKEAEARRKQEERRARKEAKEAETYETGCEGVSKAVEEQGGVIAIGVSIRGQFGLSQQSVGAGRPRGNVGDFNNITSLYHAHVNMSAQLNQVRWHCPDRVC